ncbi:MAG: hypothetical protein M3119_01545 [Verrucomicrobiota bacterium]|nr:hypothetical protein [Verrucomicrobiota bacterium]
MSAPLIRPSSEKSRPIFAALLFAAMAIAVGLSAAPQLHQWLHKIGDRSNHECAATLMSAGNVEHSDCQPASVAPQPSPAVPAFRTQLFPRVLALLGFSRLEHAPPVSH